MKWVAGGDPAGIIFGKRLGNGIEDTMDLASLKYSYVLATSEVVRHWSALSCSAVQQLG